MTKQQRCWVHKTANVLNKLPKAMQPKVKEALHDIWMADTRQNAHSAFESCIKRSIAECGLDGYTPDLTIALDFIV